MMYVKDFDAWNDVKKHINNQSRSISIRSGEIRWITMGVNVGSEIDGKGNSFTRPVLVIHVIGSHLALIIPMSTKLKIVAGYIAFEWKGQASSLCLHQMRVVSQNRILGRKGRISEEKLADIKKEVSQFFALQ